MLGNENDCAERTVRMRSGGVCHQRARKMRKMRKMRRLFAQRVGQPRRCASSRCGWSCNAVAPRRFRAGCSSDRRPDRAARPPPGHSARTSARGSAGSPAGDAASSGSRLDFRSRQNSPCPFPISSICVYRRPVRVPRINSGHSAGAAILVRGNYTRPRRVAQDGKSGNACVASSSR